MKAKGGTSVAVQTTLGSLESYTRPTVLPTRRLLLVVFVLVLLPCPVSAQQPATSNGLVDSARPAGTQNPSTPADPAPTLARSQQKPILLLLRERELINARIEGAVMALMAFLDLSPSEWELVTEGDGVKFVRRKPPVEKAEGEKK